MTVAVQGGVVTFDEGVGVDIPLSPIINARRITARRSGRSARRVGLISWANIDALLLECFPAPPSLPGTYPGVSYLYVESVDIEPWPAQPADGDVNCLGNVAVYGYAKVTIGYSVLEFDSSDLITRRSSFSVEPMLIPGEGAKWKNDDLMIAETVERSEWSAFKNISIIDHQFTYHLVPSATESTIDAAIRANIGQINDGTFEGAADETLLFVGSEKTWTIDSTGDQTFSYGHTFRERRVEKDGSVYGWLHEYREADGKWHRIMTEDGTYASPKYFYEKSADFADLFS